MKRLGLVLIAVLMFALAPAKNPQAEVRRSCLLFCINHGLGGCSMNWHYAFWPQLEDDPYAMYGAGAHPEYECYKFVCQVMHPFCQAEEQQQANLPEILDTLERAIEEEDVRGLRRMLRKNDEIIKVNANRRAIQVVTCDETIIGHLEGSEAFIQSLQR